MSARSCSLSRRDKSFVLFTRALCNLKQEEGEVMDGRKAERKERTKKLRSRGRKGDIETRIQQMKSERDVTA
jgi:hypothetical protein